MKKLIIVLLLLLSANANAKLKVVTTLPVFASITTSIAGDLVDVKSIARGTQDPHFLEPRPSYIVLASQADLFIYAGLELEGAWAPVLINQSRNPAIGPNAKGNLDVSRGIRVLEIPTGAVDRSMGDVHPSGNPHYWMDPRNSLIIASTISKKLSELDPANSQNYANGLNTFVNDIKSKIPQWENVAKSLRGQKIVSYHKSFSYLADWLGMDVAGYIEPKPGIPPNPSHLIELIKLIPEQKVKLIVTEDYHDPKPGMELSKKTGVGSVVLPTDVGTKTYADFVETLIQTLLKGIK